MEKALKSGKGVLETQCISKTKCSESISTRNVCDKNLHQMESLKGALHMYLITMVTMMKTVYKHSLGTFSVVFFDC